MASASGRKRAPMSFPYNLDTYIHEQPTITIMENEFRQQTDIILTKPDKTQMLLNIDDCIFVMRYKLQLNDTLSQEICELMPTIFKINSFNTTLIMCSAWNGTVFTEHQEPFYGLFRGQGQKYLTDYNTIIKLPKDRNIIPASSGGKRKNKNKTMRKK